MYGGGGMKTLMRNRNRIIAVCESIKSLYCKACLAGYNNKLKYHRWDKKLEKKGIVTTSNMTMQTTMKEFCQSP